MDMRVLVAGDVMLDSYWKGDSTRLSPEAPVPVVSVHRIESRLGGAANVALNLKKLGADVILCGVVGADEKANFIHKQLNEFDIVDRLVVGNIQTIEKIRLISQNQQVVRADFESPVSKDVVDTVSESILKELDNVDCVIFSDYKKGVLFKVNELIDKVRQKGKMVLIDPKGTDYSIYSGATVITPNKTELASVVGVWSSEEELQQKAKELRTNLNLDKLLLTRSEEGMTLFEEDRILNIPTEAREVYDVSGAGDTAIATLAVMLLSGKSWEEATILANRAAGIVVERFGTSSITIEDLGLTGNE